MLRTSPPSGPRRVQLSPKSPEHNRTHIVTPRQAPRRFRELLFRAAVADLSIGNSREHGPGPILRTSVMIRNWRRDLLQEVLRIDRLRGALDKRVSQGNVRPVKPRLAGRYRES